MIIIDGIHFDGYKVLSVELNLETCDVKLNTEFYSQDKVRKKEFVFKTNCDVDINGLINELDIKIKNG